MTIDNIKHDFRNLLQANHIKEKTKKALDMEFFFLQGVASTCSYQNVIVPPMVNISLLTGRSILS